MTGLDAAHRAALERLIVRARSILEQDLEAQAEGRYGINSDGTIEDEAALHLDPSALADRRELVAIVEHIREEGESCEGAVARLIREAAFTHLNRLVAIRVAEAMGLVPPSLAEARASRGFREILEVAPLVAGDETGGYWTYLRLCGDEMAGDAPVLFDPRNPLLTLSPSAAALDELVALVSDPAAREIWTASDTFGWAYQFFNTGDERRQMREESAAPRNSRELAVRNQFFTPRYVVDFLVQNTLGRRLLESDPDSPLIDALPLLVDPPTEVGEPLPLDDVRVLDPACGSGHFLLGCYDLLERAWQLKGVDPGDAAPRIVPTLWGIDIDPRCAQVASAAIVFRARRHCRDLPLPRPNIITARALPDGSESWNQVLASLPSDRRDLVQRMREALAQAPVLGPLLKVEERLAAEIRRHFTGSDVAEGTLAEGIAPDAFGEVESEVLDALQRAADSASSSAAERLLAADAADAIRFVDALRHRYTVVLMNPPYGLPAESTESELASSYPHAWTDLFSCFIERGWSLVEGSGYVGALVSSQLFQLKRLTALRRKIIDERRPLTVVHLGLGVLQGATVDTAAIVLPGHSFFRPTAYLSLSGVAPDARELHLDRSNFIAVDTAAFSHVPGNPLSFHIPTALLKRFSEHIRIEPGIADVRTGCKTFDDFRFLRLPWEVGGPHGRLRGWRPYLKGGEYQPYFADQHLLEDWRGDGAIIREHAQQIGGLAQVMQSSSYWGQSGLTFPYQSSVGFGARTLPAGSVFSQESISIFPREGIDHLSLLGLLNSTSTAELLAVFGRGRKTENGWIKGLPIDSTAVEDFEAASAVETLVSTFRALEASQETSGFFVVPLGLSAEGAKERADRVGEWHCDAPAAQREIDQAARKAMQIEHRFDIEVEDRTELIRRALPDPDANTQQWARDVLSYLVGSAFGRWDVRVGRDISLAQPLSELFDPLPLCPPGMLVGSDGLPGLAEPPDYPLPLPPGRLLVDEPGHAWDIEEAVNRAATAVFDDSDAILAEMLAILGRGSIRDYLRRQFFKDHLARYSKSRRKAPIYWTLAVPSRNWGLWLYAPSLSREMLFAVAGEATRREALAAQAIRRLEVERDAGGAGRSARNVSEALASEEPLGEELGKFRAEAERIAGLGWEPDLDDGIILCAAPLASLFPAWPEAGEERENIRKGKYPWATVSRWNDIL